MKLDSKLSGVLHVLLHMADADAPVTSAAMAGAMHTNPVVVRRLLGSLRRNKLVSSEKGHGGGWRLTCDPESVTLLDIYNALGEPGLIAMTHRSETPSCLVESTVNSVMRDAFQDAEALLLRRFGDVTLAEVQASIHRELRKRHPDPDQPGRFRMGPPCDSEPASTGPAGINSSSKP